MAALSAEPVYSCGNHFPYWEPHPLIFSLSFHMEFSVFQTHMELLAILMVVAVLGKLIGAGVAAYLSRMNLAESTVVGFAMNGRGAVELIIASVGLELGIINNTYFSLLVIIAFFTTLIPPITLAFLLEKCSDVKTALVKN